MFKIKYDQKMRDFCDDATYINKLVMNQKHRIPQKSKSSTHGTWTRFFSTRKFRKILLIIVGSVFLFVALIIIFISPIAKYVIQKYGEKYTGRKITLDWAYVNPFTGYVHLQNLKIHEYKSDSLFFSANGFNVNFALLKLFKHTFEIQSLTLNHPVITVIKDHERFNFDDVIDKLSAGDSTDTVKKNSDTASSHLNLLNLKVVDAEIHYTDRQIPFNYFIKAANFETRGMHWYEDSMAISYSFLSGPSKGSLKGEFHMNFKTSDYLIAVKISDLDLKPLEQYVKDLVNYGTIRASLEADLLAKGNFHNAQELMASGTIAIDNFHFGKTSKEDYMAFQQLKLVIQQLSPAHKLYLLSDISLVRPYMKYEAYDHSNNLETMFAKKGAETAAATGQKLNILVTIAQYVKELSHNFFRSDYKVDNLQILNAELKYNDYSLSEEFSAGLNPLTISADSINKHHRRANIYLKSALEPYGNLSMDLSIDPKDSSSFDLDYHLRSVPISMFNAYTITYTSYPLDRGSLDFNGSWNVRKGDITSDNHLLIVDPRTTKRIRGKDKKWIPLPLIFAFVRERGDVIDYHIPITGNLKNAKFHYHDVIMHLLQNIFVKPATTPYRFDVKNTEQVIEKSLMVKWQLMGYNLLPSQQKFLSNISNFLAANKNAQLIIQPVEYTAREKEYLTFFEAKKDYYLYSNHLDAASFTSKDSLIVNKMALRDPGFIGYLKREVRDTLAFSMQDKCTRLVGSKEILRLTAQLEKNRKETFFAVFKNAQLMDRLKIQPKKVTVPFDGFSFYDIAYSGSVPKELLDAYHKMNALNDEEPRKKYLNEHKKTLP
jgi:hypothetical protein